MKPRGLGLRQRVWLAVLRFAYRRLKLSDGREPDGIPGRRSPDYRCDSYTPRDRVLGDWINCDGDGHYLCAECAHFKGREEEEDDE